MISQTAEYALRAVTCLASQYNKPLTTQQMAEAAKIPAGYLSKVLQGLGREGIVQSYRGLHGGFLLTRPPKETTILEIVQAVDPIQRIHNCPLDLKSHGTNLCPLHQRLDDAMALVEQAFRETTIADLLGGEPTASKPLCETAETT